MFGIFHRFLTSTGGNIGLGLAVAAVPMVTALGASVDYGRLSHHRSELQAVLDASVLAGARVSGKEVATASGFFSSQSTTPGGSASFTLSGTEVVGTATATIPLSFGGLLGMRSMTIAARATATRPTPATPATAMPCIMALAPAASQALLVNSGARINASECEVQVKSTASPAAIFNAGTTLGLKKFCIEGTRAKTHKWPAGVSVGGSS